MTRDELAAVLRYDAGTGEFDWLEAGRGRNAGRAGTLGGNGYRQITVHGRKYQAHRLAILALTGEWPAADVDHINGNRTDNSAANLRCVPRALNMQNQHTIQGRSKTGVRGVSWHKAAAKWVARIGRQHLGLYATIQEASAARQRAETRVFTKPVSEFA